VLLKFRKEFARRPYTTLSEISDFMKVTAMRESSDATSGRGVLNWILGTLRAQE
jgi:hypothetical protein